MIAALKSLYDHSNTFVILVLYLLLAFSFHSAEVFLVLGILSDFQLKPEHLKNHCKSLDLLKPFILAGFSDLTLVGEVVALQLPLGGRSPGSLLGLH